MTSPRKVVVDIVGDAKGYGKATDDAIKATETFAGRMKKMGGEVKNGFLAGIGIGGGMGVYDTVTKVVGSVVDSIGKSIDLASDKAEAASKANVLFGNSYGIVERASRGAATAVGLSSGKYLEAAGDLGNLITNFGITGDAAASMSTDMLQLAADMGSFNNADTTDVTEAMGAAFRGETEPIRRFGVMLSAAKVEAKAMAMGLKEGKQPLTDQAKAMATYQLILEQTTAAQGDFARTADGKANADRIRAAKSEEAFTKLGEVLVPLYQSAMPLLADATTAVIDVLTNLATGVAPIVDGALRAISSSVDAIGSAVSALRDLVNPSGAEWDEITAAIMKQAKALGLNGAEVVAFVEAEKQRAAAEQRRLEVAQQLAEVDQQIADANKRSGDIMNSTNDAIIAATAAGADQTVVNELMLAQDNELARLQTELAPLLAERANLTGEIESATAGAATAADRSNTITGQASAAVDAYNRHLEELQRQQAGVEAMYPPLTRAVDASTGSFSRAAAELNLGYGSVLLGTVEAQKKAARALGPEAPQGVARAVERSVDDMFMTMEEAKGPWKAQWHQLAQWAKDPFTPEKFEDWVATRVAKAMRKASKSAGDEKQRWLKVMQAYQFIAKNNWIDPMTADIEKIMLALDLASRITDAAKPKKPRGGSGGASAGHNAGGTSNWRGGWSWVGENGPELMNLPSGTQIKSNAESMRMSGGGGGNNYTLNVSVAPGGDLVEAGRRIVDAIRQYERRSGAVWRS